MRNGFKTSGPVRDLNPGPPAPKAGIIPLDQQATLTKTVSKKYIQLQMSF